MSLPSLPWPDAPALPIEPMRPVLDRLTSLSMLYPEDVTAIPGLAMVDGKVQADPPPALEQIVDEFGGIQIRGGSELLFVISERGSEGPYTMLGEAISYYPLHEDMDTETAVILTLDEDGTPGAVYGIGADLSFRLAAADLHSYLLAYADAVEATIAQLDEAAGPDASDHERTEAARLLMRHHLFDAITGTEDDEAGDVVDAQSLDGLDTASTRGIEPAEAELIPAALATLPGVPETAAVVADLRSATLGTVVPFIDADVDGDPLDQAVFWSANGLILGLAPRVP